MEKTKVVYDGYDILAEKNNFKRFINENRFLVDECFINQFSEGDIIEVYSYPEHRQIYRNHEFNRICSYTAEQMEQMPFQKLFWREPSVQQSLIERALFIIKNNAAQAWNLPPHDLIESLNPLKRTYVMQMGWIASVSDYNGQAVAWASTVKAEFVFEWSENEKLD